MLEPNSVVLDSCPGPAGHPPRHRPPALLRASRSGRSACALRSQHAAVLCCAGGAAMAAAWGPLIVAAAPSHVNSDLSAALCQQYSGPFPRLPDKVANGSLQRAVQGIQGYESKRRRGIKAVGCQASATGAMLEWRVQTGALHWQQETNPCKICGSWAAGSIYPNWPAGQGLGSLTQSSWRGRPRLGLPPTAPE